jgi:uncharacterized protein (DUF2336 family)
MNARESLIDQLEGMLASKELSRRAEILRRVTDLFVQGSGRFSDDQIELFDDVMSAIVENIELTARVALGDRLARLPDAPGNVMRALAFDDAIEVAAPVLTHSCRLDEGSLVENARTKSQGHLLAISGRSVLTEAVTDVLVNRGNHHVLARTIDNRGVKFSTSGISTLVNKARDDSDLALRVWSRTDIPRCDLVKMFAQASEIVRTRLEAADPRRASLIRRAVADASEAIQEEARAASGDYAEALDHVRTLYSRGQLDEARLNGFVHEENFDRTVVALSLMCNLPIGLIERALVQNEPEQLLVLAKAIDLSWDTVKAMLALPGGRDGPARDRLDQCFAHFFRLQPKTARAALQFYRLQEKARIGFEQ